MKHLNILLLLSLLSCSETIVKDNDDQDDPPPPPEVCEGYQEQEPNDNFEDYNYIANIPVLGNPDNICGTFDAFDFDGVGDTYYFWLQPNCQEDHCLVSTNWIIKTHDDVVPVVKFYQSQWNPDGTVKNVVEIDTFYGNSGYLEIISYGVPWAFMTKRDLYVRVNGISPLPKETYDYEVEWWTN